jgi:hypothetical protein
MYFQTLDALGFNSEILFFPGYLALIMVVLQPATVTLIGFGDRGSAQATMSCASLVYVLCKSCVCLVACPEPLRSFVRASCYEQGKIQAADAQRSKSPYTRDFAIIRRRQHD